MCGIAGLWAPDLPAEERARVVRGMLARLHHRGPDGAALWSGDGVTLGLSRLAIVSPATEARVCHDEADRVRAVVNGEIYNHLSLAVSLAARGHRLHAGSDSEVLPHLYEEHGAALTAELDGQFALAVWDASERRLLLARDRAGEKPLYHTVEAPGRARRFAFASEAAALAGLPWVSREPDPGALARYLAHGFLAGGDSAFAAIRQVPPAHTLELRDGTVAVRRYWQPWPPGAAPGAGGHDGELAARTRAALEHAVHSRLPADVPYGVLLSGGLDSSLVAAIAARRRRRLPVFSMRLEGRGYDESAHARRVAAAIGAEYHETSMDHGEGEEALEAFAAGMDEPLGDPSLLPTWALARFASGFVPAVLTGEGGDELFAGYPTYLGHRWAGWSRRLPGPLARAALALARRLRPRHTHVSVAHVVERFLATRDMAPLERHLHWFGTAPSDEARALLAPGMRATLAPDEERGHLEAAAGRLAALDLPGWPEAPPLLAYQLLDFELYLGGGLLTKVDRCAMAHAVESRAPFLQHDLVRFAFGLPERDRLRGGSGKYALRLAARGLLPPSVLARRKQGFSPPFSAWARGPLRPLVEARLAPDRVRRAGVLDPAAVRAVLGAHLSGRAERGRALWAVLSLQMWAERWAAPRPAAAASAADVATRGAGHESPRPARDGVSAPPGPGA